MARIAVNSFLIKFLSVAHLGMLGCVFLTTISLALVRTADLPSDILLLPLFLAAALTCLATLARIRAFRLYFAGRCWPLLAAAGGCCKPAFGITVISHCGAQRFR